MLRAISALELVQACALVHDDLMDASATRRGRPTVHVALRRAGTPPPAGAAGRPGSARRPPSCSATSPWSGPTTCCARAGLDRRPRSPAAGAPWEAMRTEVLGGQYLDVLHQATGDPTRPRRAADRPVQDRRLHRRAPAAPRRRDRRRRARSSWRLPPVRRRHRRRLPAARRPARRVRRPGGHRQARGRRPARGQAHAAARAARPSGPSGRRPGRGGRDRRRGRRPRAATRRGWTASATLLAELGAVQAVEQRIAALTGSALDALAGRRRSPSPAGVAAGRAGGRRATRRDRVTRSGRRAGPTTSSSSAPACPACPPRCTCSARAAG